MLSSHGDTEEDNLKRPVVVIPEADVVSAESRLWLAVIRQAVEDLTFKPKLIHTKSHYAIERLRDAKNIRKAAYSFLFSNTPMFHAHRGFVFDGAGINTGVNLRFLRERADKFELEQI